MQAPKSLPKPQNWQDFESLCKKLWGEIWKCEEIKKNGRSGQTQHGVDVYGNPRGEKYYYGIQCKGKDGYTNKQLTQDEVLTEIEKAKNFVPKLKKLYFATTANKDAVIEAFFREKNLEHMDADLFEVHLYSWEDIVDLIGENRETYTYYVDSQNFKSSKEVDVTFENGEHEITLTPKFKQHVSIYVKDYSAEINKNLMNISALWDKVNAANSIYQTAAVVNMRQAKKSELCEFSSSHKKYRH
ncbi:restriction endonuclease [Pedobacter steynii]